MSNGETSTSLYFSFMKPVYDGLADFSYPLVRVATGAIYVPHGYQKLFENFSGTAAFFTKLGLEPASALTAYVGCIELFGGLAIALGILTRPFAALAAINLFVATFYVHWGNGFAWNKGGYEYPLLWALVMVGIFIRGGHRYSLDRKLGREF